MVDVMGGDVDSAGGQRKVSRGLEDKRRGRDERRAKESRVLMQRVEYFDASQRSNAVDRGCVCMGLSASHESGVLALGPADGNDRGMRLSSGSGPIKRHHRSICFYDSLCNAHMYREIQMLHVSNCEARSPYLHEEGNE